METCMIKLHLRRIHNNNLKFKKRKGLSSGFYKKESGWVLFVFVISFLYIALPKREVVNLEYMYLWSSNDQ